MGRQFTPDEDRILLNSEHQDFHELAKILGRDAGTVRGRLALLKSRQIDMHLREELDRQNPLKPPSPRFARPDWFDEPPPEQLAAARPGLAAGGIANSYKRWGGGG